MKRVVVGLIGSDADARPVLRATIEAARLFGSDAEAVQGRSQARFARSRAIAGELGVPLRVLEPAGHTLEGRVAGVDPDGALRLRLAGGGERRVLAGEVTLLPEEDAAPSQQPLRPEQSA